MKNVLEHKGYTGTVEFSAADEIFFGKINGVRDVVTFEADSVVKLKKAFREAVDDYIDTCARLGKDPDKEFKGSFNVRIKPRLHRLAVIKSTTMKISLNQFVEQVIAKEVAE
ncbi:MAG TPA: type II toxin-antitoxin system HicB family antitoxin [Cyclobacteriaceae bacterium]|jgi:predicted HicB family RNase H-like nuclease|nr:type II toxin-antitoxin system HicB family antitoxin [Cytophagales bacterium]HMR57313.1 type II toxin-antitoxin system HicB family antitoxin [Cyclobacteriaceae bacterium]HNT51248.1 type II toxin-antitoxin system HicB family antitoxin [Cyclobacteriaceae bacterium]HRE67633.1 type II toxin-antitoxin system HicB family antitoxin [Cyclobacteriaceae bacterium]HRF33786.1 type II toxin-antitoxin system HicB family antitoxin [Cyclobacteriaceae bacterium]